MYRQVMTDDEEGVQKDKNECNATLIRGLRERDREKEKEKGRG